MLLLTTYAIPARASLFLCSLALVRNGMNPHSDAS